MSDSLISGIWTKHAIKELENTIKQNNKESEKLQNKIFWLSVITAVLTLTQVIDIIIRWLK